MDCFQICIRSSCLQMFFKVDVKAFNFIKKRFHSAQVFLCEICEIFKNTYFEERLRTTVSVGSFHENFPWFWILSIKTCIAIEWCRKTNSHWYCPLRYRSVSQINEHSLYSGNNRSILISTVQLEGLQSFQL